jgi:glutamate synthase domain-containing protein 2
MVGLQLVVKRIRRWERSCHPRAFFQIILLVSAYMLGSIIKSYDCSQALHQMTYYEDRYKKKSKQLSQHINLLADRNLELEVAHQTQKILKQDLEKEISNKSKLMSEIDFFKSVLSPQSHVKGVYIQAMHLYPTELKSNFQFSLLLSQKEPRGLSTHGKYQVTWIGVHGGRRVLYKHEDVSLKKSNLKFSFRYYQELVGEVKFPESFRLERVLVKIKSSNSNRHTTQKEWRLKDIIIKDS